MTAAVQTGLALDGARVLVTGGAGFIGSHCVDALLDAGARVWVLDDLSSGRRERVPAERGAVLVEADIRDAAQVDAAFAQARPDGVLHLAAQVSVPRSVREPALDAAINVLGTANVVDAAIRHGARVLVNTSSGGAVYGDGPVPADESAPIAPLSPYGVSKAAAERYVEWAAREHGLRTSTMRLSNVYGPRQDDQGEAGVVAIFVMRTLAGEALELHGDGAQTRDFIHVADVARAQLTALTDPRASGAYNVGTGTETSVTELAGAVIDAVGTGAPAPTHTPARDGDVRHSRLDCTRIAHELGFTPQIALADGIAGTVRHWRQEAVAP